jgi:hypothetical protein
MRALCVCVVWQRAGVGVRCSKCCWMQRVHGLADPRCNADDFASCLLSQVLPHTTPPRSAGHSLGYWWHALDRSSTRPPSGLKCQWQAQHTLYSAPHMQRALGLRSTGCC